MPVTITTTKEERAALLLTQLREVGLYVTHIDVRREADHFERMDLGSPFSVPMTTRVRTIANLQIEAISPDAHELLYYMAVNGHAKLKVMQ